MTDTRLCPAVLRWDLNQIGGRGLWLVQALTADAGGPIRMPADADGGGKSVEVRLPLTGFRAAGSAGSHAARKTPPQQPKIVG